MTRESLLTAYRAMGKNFMTPHIMKRRYLTKRNTVIELSSGRGFRDDPIYGVSVLTFDESGNRIKNSSDQSRCFHDYSSALTYFKDL